MVTNFLIVLKKSTTDAIKAASKRAIKKNRSNLEATGDLIGNKLADKITSVSNKKANNNIDKYNNDDDGVELTTHKKDINLQKKDSKLLII